MNDGLSGSQSLTGTVTIYVGETHPQQKQFSRRKKKKLRKNLFSGQYSSIAEMAADMNGGRGGGGFLHINQKGDI